MSVIRYVPIALLVLALTVAPRVQAVEVIPASQLAEQCRDFLEQREGVGRDYCIHYVQGFIDGAVSTDVRVMLNVEAEYASASSITERAARTRMRGWHSEEQRRAASYAEFCLGDPVPLEEVVGHVATALVETQAPDGPARDAVYAALRERYPC